MTNDFAEKIKRTSDRVESVFSRFSSTRMCVLSSFGKDSMVLLWMLKNWWKVPTVVQFRVPWQIRRYAFANFISEMWDLEFVPHCMPSKIGLLQTSFDTQHKHVIYSYSIDGALIDVPFEPRISGEFVCAADQMSNIVNQSNNMLPGSVDCLLSAAKQGDRDNYLFYGVGPSALYHHTSGKAFAFPIYDWTDDEISEFTHAHSIPYDAMRYALEADSDKIKLREDAADSNKFSYCSACLNAKEPVACPKYGGATIVSKPCP